MKVLKVQTLCPCLGAGSLLPQYWHSTASMVADVCQSTLAEIEYVC
ncbi:MAG: hypothetical protein IKY31_02320 [Bacteroidaceae bacterium]|nr:hypothetical protein [Bacteroidaceae bacterium]